jgi:hypothetical protein
MSLPNGHLTASYPEFSQYAAALAALPFIGQIRGFKEGIAAWCCGHLGLRLVAAVQQAAGRDQLRGNTYGDLP